MKRSTNNYFTILLAGICLISVLITTYYFLQYNKLKFFSQQVTQIYSIPVINPIKKIVYAYDPSKSGFQIYITNSIMDPSSAKLIAEGLSPIDLKIQNVNFYNKDYAIMQYGIGHGVSDFLIFDLEGNIITRSLLQENIKILNYQSMEIITTSEDGTLLLKMVQNTKEETLRFDITTGKLK